MRPGHDTQSSHGSHRPEARHSSNLLGIAYLGTIGVVMVAWIGSLVWATMAFFSWLVS
ncbi:hypothetical protein [Bradyrhizobium liaoningense]|uniref:hypothetical protein n=1 Tax=Bradyrhizobium liaoningense TaxID=43992 RepID=UPI0004B9D87E|nr:hypothetical protein [Bradyrhizobium liaoningense]